MGSLAPLLGPSPERVFAPAAFAVFAAVDL